MVGDTASGRALGEHGNEKSAGATAGVLRTSDPVRPALEILPNLSLNVSDALRATRAESGTTCHCLAHLRRVTNIHGDIIVSNANTAAVGELCTV